MITTKVFGRLEDGREVLSFTIADGGKSATVLNLGATLQSVIVPDRNGKPTDVVLGYNTVEDYMKNRGYLGATVGRFANRIAEGKLFIDGELYQLACTDRGNHIHGGPNGGFNKKIWAYEIAGDEIRFTHVSPDGEENYPGTVKVTVTYSFRGGELKIRYHATTDKKTAINLTNHSYFNLSGEGDGDILDHILTLKSECITPTTETMVPVGGFKAVKGTPFDFNTPKAVGQDIEKEDKDLVQGKGYDHCFVLGNKCGEMVEYAKVLSPKTGIVMTCSTDMPAVQLYTGNGLHQDGKSIYYGKRSGLCLETQMIPNNVNVPEYAAIGSSVLAPEEVYEFTATYKFEL